MGPVILDNIVWVTKDVETAKKLFKVQSDKNTEMPEREVNRDAAKGPFPFVVKEGQMPKELAEDASAMSACVDCDVKTVILTHHRIVLRKGNVVTVVYIFGRDNVATPEVAIWHARQVADRM